MIGRIAHREHSCRQTGKAVGQRIVFIKIVSHSRFTCKIFFHDRCKIAVTKPAGPFTRRAIHENINGILPVCLPCSLVYFIQFEVVATECCLFVFGIGIFAQVNILNLAFPFQYNYFQKFERISLKSFNIVLPGFELVNNLVVNVIHPFFCVYITVGQHLVEIENDS